MHPDSCLYTPGHSGDYKLQFKCDIQLALPLYYGALSSSEFWALFFVAEFMTGYWLAWNFEVSHIAEDVHFPAAPATGKAGAAELPDSWAVAQVRTSVNYALDSVVATYLSGALNYQIEHHLFPCVSQYHYPALAPIVRKTCKEFGIPYKCEPSFYAAWSGHIRHLGKGRGRDVRALVCV